MADEAKPVEGVIPRYSYNPVPVIYADAIANVATGPGLVRTYLIRFDPSLREKDDARPSLVAQLIMPTNGFLMMAYSLRRKSKACWRLAILQPSIWTTFENLWLR